MSSFMEAPDGPTMRIDVYPKYREAVVDRPIVGRLEVRIPADNEELSSLIEQFDTFGEELVVSDEFATVQLDDPLTGDNRPRSVNFRIGRPATTSPIRLRLFVAETSGEILGEAFFNVESTSQGPSGRGFVGRLRSDSGAVSIEHRVNFESQDPKPVAFTVRVEWVDKVAAKIASDVHFAGLMRAPRDILVANEFGGEKKKLIEMRDFEGSPVQDWLEQYVSALATLQDFADRPLLVAPPEVENDQTPITWAIMLASFVRGKELKHRFAACQIGVENVDDLVTQINDTGELAVSGPFSALIGEATIMIPNAFYSASDVNASVVVVGGERRVLVTGRNDHQVEVSVTRLPDHAGSGRAAS